MKIIFFGTSEFAVPSLRRLVESGHKIPLCITTPERPQGRGLVLKPSPVKQACKPLNIACEEPKILDGEIERLASINPDVGVVISYGKLIPKKLLNLPLHGMLGLHPSLLPRYRGASPMVWTVLNDEKQSGVTVFRLNEGWDSGDILLQKSMKLHERQTSAELHDYLALDGAEALIEALELIREGKAVFIPQDESKAVYCPKISKSQGTIDWDSSAESIDRLIRALNPWPGAYTEFNGGIIKIWKAIDVAKAHSAKAGEVLSVSKDGIEVAAGKGSLIIQELQPANRRRMSSWDFVVGHALKPKDVLGRPVTKK